MWFEMGLLFGYCIATIFWGMVFWLSRKKQSPQNHAPDKIGGADEGKKGQALG